MGYRSEGEGFPPSAANDVNRKMALDIQKNNNLKQLILINSTSFDAHEAPVLSL